MISNWLVLVTILAAPLYVVRFNIAILPTTLLEVLIIATVVAWAVEEVAAGRIKDWRQTLGSEFSWLALALLAVSTLAVLISPTPYQALGLWRAYFLEPVLFYFVVLTKLRQGLSSRILIVWLLSGVSIALLALIQKFTGQLATPESAHELTLGRAAAVFNSANDVPLFLGPLAAVSLALVRKTKLVWVAAILIFAAIWVSGSRGGTIALGVVEGMILIGWLLMKIPANWRQIFWRIATVAGVLAVIGLVYLLVNIDQFAPEGKIVYPRSFSGTNEVRICLWQGTRNLLQDHSIFGVGLNGFRVDYPAYRTCDSEELQYPHNIFLNVWTELGLAGLLAFALIYLRAFKALVGENIRHLAKVSLIAALSYSLVHGLVDVPYFKNDLGVEFWLLLAVIAAAQEKLIPEFKD